MSEEGNGRQAEPARGARFDRRTSGGDRRRRPRRPDDALSPAGTEHTEEGGVIITGICGRLGRRLARQLHRQRPVIGIDRRSFPERPKDIDHHQVDVRRKKTRDIFRRGDIGALVHLGVMHDPRDSPEEHLTFNIGGFQKLVEYVKLYDIPKLVVLSSANVYGPRPDNPQFLSEDAALVGAATFPALRDLVELDMLAQSFFWKHPQTETVILRPTHILGTVRNAPSNYLRLKVVPTLMGFDPMVQVVHQDDVVNAIMMALRPGVRGIFNIAGPPPLPLSHAIRGLGRTQLPVPHPIAKMGIDRLFRLHVTSFPAQELDFIRYVCMVDDTRAREVLGYTPRFTLEQTLQAVDEERWI